MSPRVSTLTLSPPRALAFSIAGGVPTDASSWVAVDLDAFAARRSRGIIVAAESVETSGAATELARLARDLIVAELRAMHDLPPEEAIGRAFAAANGMMHDEGQTNPIHGYDRKILTGATAILFDGHICTIGYVPPGQVVLVQDSFVYAVPNLESWLPDYNVLADQPTISEPLGFSSWTAPLIAQTQVDDGDSIILCAASLAEQLASDLDDPSSRKRDLQRLYGRSPDHTLELFRSLLLSDRIENGSAIVVAFPPRPGSFGIVSFDDVKWRLRDRRRRFAAQTRSLLPAPLRAIASPSSMRTVRGSTNRERISSDDADDEWSNDGRGSSAHTNGDSPGSEAHPRWRSMTSRLGQGRSAETWNQPTQTQQYGLPRTHGVQLHRSVTTDRGGTRWRNDLPGFRFSGVILTVLVLSIVLLAGFGVWRAVADQGDDAVDQSGVLAQVDQYIVAAEESSTEDEIRQSLEVAQTSLNAAERAGAPAGEIAPRQAAITRSLDELDNVIRVDNLTRVGTLPVTLQGGGTKAQVTPSGLFLVNGGLYQIRTDQRQIVPILEEGETTSNVTVGSLFGIAFDATGLYVSDGAHVFGLQSDGTWRPVEMGDINDLGAWNAGPMGAFGGSIYILETEYRNIYRFDATTAGIAEPYDWVLSAVRPDLVNAVDMAIDANIYVLVDNESSADEVLTYLKGDLDTRNDIPGIEAGEPRAVLIGAGTQLLYVAVQDGDNGWVVVFDTDSGRSWQLRVPSDFSADDAEVSDPFSGLQDIAIDENSGTLYVVNDDAVWTAQYQLPIAPEGTPTPEVLDDEAG